MRLWQTNNSLKPRRGRKMSSTPSWRTSTLRLKHYRGHFAGKTVLCNCDDPRMSNFFYYFVLNFHYLGLKKLITTCYKNQNPNSCSKNISKQAVYLVYEGEDIGSPPTLILQGWYTLYREMETSEVQNVSSFSKRQTLSSPIPPSPSSANMSLN